MKCLTCILVPLLLLTTHSFAQESTEEDSTEVVYEEENTYIDYNRQNFFHILDTLTVGIGISGATMPFIHQQSFGLGLDLQIPYTNNLSVGLSAAVTGRKVDPKFGYQIGESRLLYYDINLYNQAKLAQWKRLAVAFRLNTGYAAFHLSDNSIKESYVWYDEYGIAYEGERPLAIATNKFFKIAPALHLSYQVAYQVVIEASAAYHFYLGNAQYGRRSDFNNYMLQLGIKCYIN